MNFSFEITPDEDLHVIALTGSLMSKEQAEDLLDKIAALFSQKLTKIIIDLSEIQYMNSTGLSVLINIFTQTKNNGGKMIITNVPEKINELLTITKLDSVFNITTTLGEAKQSMIAQ